MSRAKSPAALVTGASSGIGEATARILAQAGYAVGLAARRADQLERLAAEIRASGGVALPLPVDVQDDGQIGAMARAAEAQLGPLDVLVNNAGVGQLHRAWRPSDEVLANVLDTNLLGPIRVTRAVAAGMVERGRGHIISIGSVAAYIATPGNSLYAASKAGLRAWHVALRRELRGTGVHVSLVSPGYIRTPMTAGVRAPMALPELIGASVLQLVRKPRREVIVPRYYGLLTWLEWFAPGLVDLVLARMARQGH